MFKRVVLFVFAALLLVGLVAGCGGGKKAIQIKGSDTMVNLGQAWAEEYMKLNPEVSLAVTGGGSGTGIAALLNKTTDLAMSSRDIEKKELEQASKLGLDPQEIIVAYDGISVVVSPKNPVNKLTIKQLSDVFSGKITNWQELGGPDKKIVVLSRDRNVFFAEHVVKLGDSKNPNEFGQAVLMMPSNQAIVEEVSGNTAAIGYVGLGYMCDKLKSIAVAKDESSPYLIPCIKSVANKTYPIARSLQLYTDKETSQAVKDFIAFILSDAGQKVVLKMDFVPLAK